MVMNNLIESILNNDYVSANQLFESRMEEIAERKLFEAKRAYAAKMDEGVGGLTKKEIEDRKARGYVRASEVLPDPREIKMKLNKKVVKKKVVKEAAPAVQPDPESKVRGGEAKSAPVKGTFKRKAAAAVLKTARKVGTAAGDVAVRLSRAKTALQAYKDERAAAKGAEVAKKRKAAPAPADRPEVDKTTGRPNVIARNLNTLVGKEPGYKAEPKKEIEKGGKVGKALNLGYRGISKLGSEIGW